MTELIEALNNLDNSIFLGINGLHWEWLDGPMRMLTGRWIWLPFYILIAVIINDKKGLRTTMAIILCTALAIGLADWVCASGIRPIVERLRPSNPENPISAMTHVVDGYRSTRYGFPSCHAANSFAFVVFTALSVKVRWLTIMMVLWALLLCYSRIYLGVHYPGDILVGAAVGSLSSIAVYRFIYPPVVRIVGYHKK